MLQDSGADRVMGWLAQFVDSISFTRVGEEKALGQDTAEVIIHGSDPGSGTGIMGRIERQVTPDDQPWPENSEPYATDKEEKYGWREVNRRTGIMTSEESLRGHLEIQPDRLTMNYGTGQPASQSHSPTGYISPGDRKITDVEKAQFAHAAGRGFFGLGEGDAENVSAVGQAAVDQWIREANGG